MIPLYFSEGAMSMNEIAIQVIMDYVEENLFEPQNNWPKDIFEERAYSRWAAFELINRIIDHPKDPPDIVIENFIFEMIRFSHETENREKCRVFTIASEVAEDIIYLFL